MSILNKIFTAFRGGVREVGESIVDKNAIRILEQEIEDQKDAVHKAKKSLTEVMAHERQADRQVNALKERITEHEGYAMEAMDKGKEDIAVEIAEKIAGFENELAEQEQIKTTYGAQVKKLKQQVKDAERSIKDNSRQLSIVKTTDSVQKATESVSDSLLSNRSTTSSARDSLARIRKKQEMKADQLKAAQELHDEESGADLKARMEAEGIGGSKSKSNDVLARLRAKKTAE